MPKVFDWTVTSGELSLFLSLQKRLGRGGSALMNHAWDVFCRLEKECRLPRLNSRADKIAYLYGIAVRLRDKNRAAVSNSIETASDEWLQGWSSWELPQRLQQHMKEAMETIRHVEKGS